MCLDRVCLQVHVSKHDGMTYWGYILTCSVFNRCILSLCTQKTWKVRLKNIFLLKERKIST